MKIKSTLLTVAALALTNAAALADTFSLTGDTTSGLTFNRTIGDGSILSDVGTDVHYYGLSFIVGTSGSYDFSAVANNPANYDTFIHVYDANFNPVAPLIGFIAANDDAGANPNLGSALSGISLTAGVTYNFVVNGFGNTDFGSFNASISGPGTINIAPVPEPSIYALVTLGVAGLWFARRRQIAAC